MPRCSTSAMQRMDSRNIRCCSIELTLPIFSGSSKRKRSIGAALDTQYVVVCRVSIHIFVRGMGIRVQCNRISTSSALTECARCLMEEMPAEWPINLLIWTLCFRFNIMVNTGSLIGSQWTNGAGRGSSGTPFRFHGDPTPSANWHIQTI